MNETRASRPARVLVLAAVAAVLVAGGVAGGFWLGARQPAVDMVQSAEGEKKVLYWYDPMVPDQHFDKPGKSPFMDMQLVARYAGEPEPKPGVRIDPGVAQNLGLRFATVEKTLVKPSIMASGVIAFNERDVAIVQAKRGGFVERGRNRAVGDIVRAGEPLIDLRVPGILAVRPSDQAAQQLAAIAKANIAKNKGSFKEDADYSAPGH